MQAQQVQAAVPPAPPVSAPAAAGGNEFMTELQQLAQMKESGLLTDEEFQAAKTRLFAG
jgi:hypothetical protein